MDKPNIVTIRDFDADMLQLETCLMDGRPMLAFRFYEEVFAWGGPDKLIEPLSEWAPTNRATMLSLGALKSLRAELDNFIAGAEKFRSES